MYGPTMFDATPYAATTIESCEIRELWRPDRGDHEHVGPLSGVDAVVDLEVPQVDGHRI